ncbi:hypothetical protein LQ938_03790 [Microbacterium sp. cx-55]|uniref:hypothetical protein n=1 Tax=Microbacterium sp. cx-55 TaxID=2875948 RepID=UPI001CBC7D70|nr:hypothetical protein [Microbacterium sp. cx-55]MBZ4487013.1 hypothetical protein [Microbacterium sp. cx-55]UGB35932.1 hypothetical protein LQ938_03790 [Microbacterium sp. cx-55]
MIGLDGCRGMCRRRIGGAMNLCRWTAAACAAPLILTSIAAGGAANAELRDGALEEPDLIEKSADESFHLLAFAHPVSLESATSVTSGANLPIEGYHFESESITGDYWLDGGLTVETFLDEVVARTGTFPEVTAAYVDAPAYADRRTAKRGAEEAALGVELPVYEAPPADPSLAAASRGSEKNSSVAGERLAATDTWQPNDAETMITPMGSNLAISAKYSWWGFDPYASPLSMANSWGMEFQTDFYSANRPWPPGTPINFPGKNTRPNCSAMDYKDWGAASNQPFDWFGWVISGDDYVAAPGSLGLYGDYNDATDPCTVSSIAVGMANPQAMPWSTLGTNHLDLYIYPKTGQAAQSPVGAIVQPVSRNWCEINSWMPLTDCMGVTPGTYPGPGPTQSRMVLNSANNNLAPSLCWYSSDFGTVPATFWDCSSF